MWTAQSFADGAAASNSQRWLSPTAMVMLILPQISMLCSASFTQWLRSIWNSPSVTAASEPGFDSSFSFVPYRPTEADSSPERRPRVRNAGLDDPPYLTAALILAYPIFPALLLRVPDWASLGPYLAWILICTTLALLGRPGVGTCSRFDAPFLIALAFPVLLGTRNQNWLGVFDDDQYVILEHWPALSLIRISALHLALVNYLVLRGFNRIRTVRDIKSRYLKRFLFALIVFAVVAFPVSFGMQALHFSPNVSFFSGLGCLFCIFWLIGIPQAVLFQGIVQELISGTFEVENSRVEFPSDDEVALIPKPSPSWHQTTQMASPLIVKDSTPVDVESKASQFLRWVSLPTWFEWMANFVAAMIFAFTMLDYGLGSRSVGECLILLFLGFCSGWLWRTTRGVVFPALLHTLVVFIGVVLGGFETTTSALVY